MKKTLFVFIATIGIGLAGVGCDTSSNRDNTTDAGRSGGTKMTNTELKNAVEVKIASDPQLKAADLDVDADADRNEVTISGKVGSQALRTRAVELARSANSGLMVNDKIDVLPGEVSRESYTEEQAKEQRDQAAKRGESVGSSLDDAWIHAKLAGKLIANPDTPKRKINVDVNNNVVTLRGIVPTATERAEAEQVARSTDGVKKVINQIKVEPGSGSTPSNR